MNHDLDAALRDLASGAAAAHRARAAQDDGLVLRPTVRRVRRRRRARAATAVTGALVVVAGLSIGGFALTPDPKPQPAAPTPTPSVTTPAPRPTSTPTRTPEPPALVLPTGDPSLPFGACGALATAVPQQPVDDTYEAHAELLVPAAPAGSNVEVRGWVDHTVTAPEDFRFWAVRDAGPQVAVVRDGVVVGTGLVGGEAAWQIRGGFQGEFRWTADWLPLAVCAPDGQPGVSAGAPLPAGEYQLVPWSDVADLGDSEAALTTAPGEWLSPEEAIAAVGTRATAVGEPVPLTITGTADGVDPVPGADAEPTDPPVGPALSLCGDPAPTADPTGSLVVEWPAAGTTITLSEEGTTDAAVRYTGGGRLGFSLTEPSLVVSRDGRVVGATAFSGEGGWRPLLASGTSVPVTSWIGGLTDCDYAPLPPGTYDVVVVVSALPDERPVSPDQGDAWSRAVSAPATLVIP